MRTLLPFIAVVMISVAAYNLQGPKDTVELVDMVRNETVLIENRLDAKTGGIGTGFIIGKNVIVTNNHVIDGNGTITIITADSHKYKAKVLHTDPVADIAVVQLDDWDKFDKEQAPGVLDLGDSDKMVPGSKVVVIGHPWGLTWTVSEGIISAKNRRPSGNPKFVDQIDAKLFQGNSGGPVFNQDGEVICVSELMLTGDGGSYGFCLPSNLVKKVLHDFQTLGEVRWRALNLSIGLTDDGSSVIINTIEENGAASKAGMKVGDKLLEIYTPNNHPHGVRVAEPDDIISELAAMNGDDEKVKILVERNGEKMMIEVTTSYKLSKDYDSGKK